MRVGELAATSNALSTLI